MSTEKIRKTSRTNVPLVEQESVICITGNAIDRQPQNGGNGIGSQYVSQDKCVMDEVYSRPQRLIRRLTPLECERLQGFPDGWTDIPGASDSARYKALGNSVAIPCVDFVMHCLVQAVQMSENIR